MAKHSNIHLDKSLGQHFLTDQSVLLEIYAAINKYVNNSENILEVGPGAGALTFYLQKRENYKLVEFDTRWVSYIEKKYPHLKNKIIAKDFLKIELDTIYNSMAVVGNFPYNISSQILFKILDYKENVPIILGMFQKEVAERVCAKPSTKAYGILSILMQAYYETEYLFDVPKEAFNPPPKVVSGVILLKRKSNIKEDYNPILFKQLVKLSFQQRRKTLRNSLSSYIKNEEIKQLEIFDARPDALSLEAFINLTNILSLK